MCDFDNELKKWDNFKNGYLASTVDIDDLLEAAKIAKPYVDDSWMWVKLAQHLATFTSFDKKEAQAEARKCRISADLGKYPRNAEEFVKLFLKARGYTMKFSGAFTQNGRVSSHDRDYIGKAMKMWAKEFGAVGAEVTDWAFDNYVTDERDVIKEQTYHHLKFDPAADPDLSELKAMVRLIVRPRETDEETERYFRAAEIAFRAFIYRTKNHLRGVMKHSAHLMPILYGNQGDGKSELLKHLCSPLKGMHASVSFSAFNDNSLSYQFSIMPVLIFEEMQGVQKTDVEALKTIMNDEERLMREAYAKAGVRTIVSTFAAATNKTVTSLIKDETGNRRLFEIETQSASRATIRSLDVMKIWKSVNEDAEESPQYESDENFELLKSYQDQQRHKSAVEEWILDAPASLPFGHAHKASTLFTDSFRPWLEDTGSKFEQNRWSATELGKELARLQKTGKYDITNRTAGGGVMRWTIERDGFPRIVNFR